MPQQINLSTPVLLTQKRYFSAQAMLQTLALFVVLGGALAAYGVWSLRSASAAFTETLAVQAPELARLRSALAVDSGNTATDDKRLEQELQAARGALAERKAVLETMGLGLVRPGFGHSARLRLVAQTIPPVVWVTSVLAEPSRLEVVGFTQEPAALNDWVAKLAQSPLLASQQLTQVKVEAVGAAVPGGAARVGAVPLPSPGTGKPAALWSFALVSAVVRAPDAASDGAKP